MLGKKLKMAGAILLSLGLLLTAGCSGAKKGPDKNGVYKIKFGSTGNNEHQYTVYGKYFKQKVEELTNGKVQVEIYPNNALGNEREMAESTLMGTIEMCCVTSDGTLPSWVPETQILSIPYLFANKKEAYYVLDHTLQDYLEPKFEAKGAKHLAFAELGFRHFTNNTRPIKKASDMKGMKIRVQEAPVWFALMNDLQATATPVPFAELYTALQQGMVDGEENPIASVASSKFYEVQKYISGTDHMADAWLVGINSEVFKGLSEKQQDAITKAGEEVQQWNVDFMEKEDETALQTLLDNGMEYNDISDEGREEFVKVSQSCYDKFKELIDDDELFDATAKFCGKN